MILLQKPIFGRIYKKLKSNQLKFVNEAINTILNNPLIGERKIGDLNGVRVYKFKTLDQLTLLAYDYDEDKKELTLLFLGSHENFYNQLKKIR